MLMRVKYKSAIVDVNKAVVTDSGVLEFSVVTKYHKVVPEETVIFSVYGLNPDETDKIMSDMLKNGYVDITDMPKIFCSKSL